MSSTNSNNDNDNNNKPDNANDECVGPSSQQAGTAQSCEGCPNQGACASGANAAALAQQAQDAAVLQQNLANVSHVVLVLSGKGGVGKSTVASQLAMTLASQPHNFAVGLLDVDLCGPSAPRFCGCHKGSSILKNQAGLWIPQYPTPNLAVMSIGFLLSNSQEAVIWRGPRKNNLIQQFLSNVDWTGDTEGLDYLIIDTPPGTSDEHISTVQYLTSANAKMSAIVVTTPEEASLMDVRKELNFCQKTKLPVLGVIENMGRLEVPLSSLTFHNGGASNNTNDNDVTQQVLDALQQSHPELLNCTVSSDVFAIPGHGTGASDMAKQFGTNFWGCLPLDPALLRACDNGVCYATTEHKETTTAKRILEFCRKLTEACPVEE